MFRPRRILFLITDLKIGGMPSIVRDTVIRLAATTAAHFEVACLSPWGPVADQLQQAGIRVTPLGARGQLDLRVLHNLAALIRERRYDTVFSFLVHANAAAAAISRQFPGVRFLQCIQTTQPRPRWHWPVQGLAHRAAEKVVAPSDSVAQALRRRAHVPANKIVLIPNAVDPAEFPAAPPAGHGPFPIGFIGRLDPVKRLPDLLQAVQLLAGRAHLHVFGDGADRANIEDTINRLHFGLWVTLHGSVPKPQIAHRQIAMLALPSIAEGLPMVLIEAMAARIPIVASNAPGIRDVIRHEENGLLVPPRSPAALAKTIGRMINDESLRNRLVDQAARDVREHYAWAAVLAKYAELLDIRP